MSVSPFQSSHQAYDVPVAHVKKAGKILTEQSGGQRVATLVLHVSDVPQDLDRAVTTARSLGASQPDVQVRIIVNGPALDGMASAQPGQLPAGSSIAACLTGLRNRGIDPAQLPSGVQTVDSALLAIAQEQLAGAAYIRL